MKVGLYSRGVMACTVAVFGLMTLMFVASPAKAATPAPQQGSIGLEATIKGNPPTRGATIAVPANGSSFNSTPITISGLCQTGLLVKVFSNGVFIGSATCVGG